MIDLDRLLAAAATQVHLTRCEACSIPSKDLPACWGYTEVDLGVATAVLDVALKHLYQDMRLSLWAAHRTVTP